VVESTGFEIRRACKGTVGSNPTLSANKADVLRLALNGHLTLSVDFVNHGKGDHTRQESC
jgi:hypothetical protein